MAFVNSNSYYCTSALFSAEYTSYFDKWHLNSNSWRSFKAHLSSFLAKKQTTPTAKDREELSAKYHHLTIDWKRVYLLSFRTTLETKLREFQFKILNRIVFTNEKLFRFDMAESDKCAFCQTEVESIEHLLFSCKISSVFWKHVLSWLRDNNIIVESLKEKDIIIGKFDVGYDFLLESYFIAWEVLYLFTKRSKGYALPSGVHY